MAIEDIDEFPHDAGAGSRPGRSDPVPGAVPVEPRATVGKGPSEDQRNLNRFAEMLRKEGGMDLETLAWWLSRY